MASGLIPPRNVFGFDRRLVQDGDRTLIHSICLSCGWTITGSANNGLPEREADHRAICRFESSISATQD